MRSLKILVHAQMTIDITPTWWRGGPHTFADGAALLTAMERKDYSEPMLGIERDVVEVVISVHGVRLLLAMTTDHTMAQIEAERVALVRRLDALANTNEAWARQIKLKADMAAEKRSKTSLATAQA